MIRLFGTLCIAIFVTLLILGEDHGQKRYGLMMADKLPAKIMAKVTDAEPKAVYIPAKPAVQTVQISTNAPKLVSTKVDTMLPNPDIPGGKLFTVAGRGANVREGPGTTFAILDSLIAGEQVLVVNETQPIEGWSKVKIEGDGVEGYIASRLLNE